MSKAYPALVNFLDSRIKYLKLTSHTMKPGTPQHTQIVDDLVLAMMSALKVCKAVKFDDGLTLITMLQEGNLPDNAVATLTAAVNSKVTLSATLVEATNKTENLWIDAHLTEAMWTVYNNRDVDAMTKLQGMA